MILVLISKLFQGAQLNGAEQASSSPPVAPEEPAAGPSSSSTEAADGCPHAAAGGAEASDAADATTTPEQQTSDQPTETLSEAPGSSAPIDLSNKKSPEPESNTGTSITAGEGTEHLVFITTDVRLFVGENWCTKCVTTILTRQ